MIVSRDGTDVVQLELSVADALKVVETLRMGVASKEYEESYSSFDESMKTSVVILKVAKNLLDSVELTAIATEDEDV